MYSEYSKYPSYPGWYETQVITSGHHRSSHQQLPRFTETFHGPGFPVPCRLSMYGSIIPNHPQPRSATPFTSFHFTDTKKLFSAPSNTNTSEYLDNKDYSKLEEILNKDNVDEEYKHLISQQIAKIQHSRAEDEKQKLLEKEKKAYQDAIAYFEKLEEEKNMLYKRLKGKIFWQKKQKKKKIQEAKEKQSA